MKYLYKCPKCDCTKEVEHGMTENPRILCEECHGPPLELMQRVIEGGSGFLVKGKFSAKNGYSNSKTN